MEISDNPASLLKLPDAPAHAPATANAAKAPRENDAAANDDDIIAAALSGRFVLSAEEASSLASALHLPSVAALVPKLVSSASRSAWVPTSRYRVGAAALGASGRVFVGANLELPRAPLSQSVHAEQFVVALASQRKESGLKRIAVSAPPCGHCRQFCCELNCADELEFVFGEEAEEGEGVRERRGEEEDANGAPASTSSHFSSSVATLRALLPRHFGPHDLAKASGTKPKLLLNDSGVSLELTPRSLAAVSAAAEAATAAAAAEVKSKGEEKGEAGAFPVSALAAAAEAALCAARASHTPHTRCPAGLALVWRDERSRENEKGEEREEKEEEEESKTAKLPSSCASSSLLLRVSAGGAIESAAYNPSLPPLQAALVAAVADGMPPYSSSSSGAAPSATSKSKSSSAPPVILGAVLLERPRARVSHAAATRAALAAFASSANSPPPPLIVLHARGAARAPGAAEGESGYESGGEEEEEEEQEEDDENERGGLL